MWGYPNTFGLGLHEYLQWCEDLGAAPLFVVNAGIDHAQVAPMAEMGAFVQDPLDAIEYANGPVTSRWGAERAKNGHPAPFGLKYVEIGNENGSFFHGGNDAYAPRYRLIHDAIKAKYPDVTTIADTKLPDAPLEVVDEHYYSDPSFFWKNANRYDAYDRSGPKVYVGEYAVTQGAGRGNLDAALGEAAFMTGLERNSDVVAMASYAPLFTSVYNRQWNPNAIVFDTGRAYGTPSYHVQAMFARNRATRNVPITVPSLMSEPPKPGGNVGLMTWDTTAEFKDLRLTTEGKSLAGGADLSRYGMAAKGGVWKESEGTITQSQMGTGRTLIFPGSDTTGATKVALSLKARKIEGREGFLFIVEDRDGSQLRWNLGGWGDTSSAFERNGTVVGERVPVTVEPGRWYDVRIERSGATTKAYLDGKLVQEVTETGAPDLAAVAGIDEKAKELVVKVVNGSDEARTATLDVSGGKVAARGRAIVLTGYGRMAENSFDAPTAVAPVESTFEGASYTFAPRSVTVLRLPIR